MGETALGIGHPLGQVNGKVLRHHGVRRVQRVAAAHAGHAIPHLEPGHTFSHGGHLAGVGVAKGARGRFRIRVRAQFGHAAQLRARAHQRRTDADSNLPRLHFRHGLLHHQKLPVPINRKHLTCIAH